MFVCNVGIKKKNEVHTVTCEYSSNLIYYDNYLEKFSSKLAYNVLYIVYIVQYTHYLT